jgi:hypothetical protein
LELALLERRIPKRRYMDEGDLQQVLTAAPFYNASFTLRSGAAKNEFYSVSA